MLLAFPLGKVVAQQTNSSDNRIISYQGSLSSHEGAPKNGIYQIVITLYTDEEGKQLVWQESYNATVTNGIFSVELGNGTTPLPSSQILDKPIWLGVTVGNTSEMRPLTRLGSSVFALAVAENSISSEKLQDGAVTRSKIGTDYVASVRIDGKKISGKGTSLNLESGPGMLLNYDEATNSLILSSNSGGIGGKQSPQWIGNNPCGNNNDGLDVTNTIGGGCLNTTTPLAPGYASIIGGKSNTASGQYSVVAGGNHNMASPLPWASIIGGLNNTASGVYSTIGGGRNNNASGDGSFIGGGGYSDNPYPPGIFGNTASGISSVVGGGYLNTAASKFTFIGGGESNITTGNYAAIGGGLNNEANFASVIGGGINNTASGYGSFVGGGGADGVANAGNTVSGNASAVVGGMNNSVSEDFSIIGGGHTNTIVGTLGAGNYAVIGGGEENTITGSHSTIGGGKNNQIPNSQQYTTISGGSDNTANGQSSVIGGGGGNIVNSLYSIVGGGFTNKVTGTYSAIVGGNINQVESDGSFIGGGYSNTISFEENPNVYSAIVGGTSNVINYTGTTNGGFSFIGGGQYNTINSSYGSILGGYQNTVKLDGYAASAQGDNTIANSWAQTVIGAFNVQSGSVPPNNNGSPLTNVNEKIFIVGNGINNSNRSNAFAVSYNGHSIVYGNNGGGSPSVRGATFQDNVVYAWGEIEPPATPWPGVPTPITPTADFGIANVMWMSPGVYEVILNVDDPDGNSITLGSICPVVTIRGDRVCRFVSCIPTGLPNRFQVAITQFTSGTCSPSDASFYVQVTGRP